MIQCFVLLLHQHSEVRTAAALAGHGVTLGILSTELLTFVAIVAVWADVVTVLSSVTGLTATHTLPCHVMTRYLVPAPPTFRLTILSIRSFGTNGMTFISEPARFTPIVAFSGHRIAAIFTITLTHRGTVSSERSFRAGKIAVTARISVGTVVTRALYDVTYIVEAVFGTG